MMSIPDRKLINSNGLIGLLVIAIMVGSGCRDQYNATPSDRVGIFSSLNDTTILMSGTIKTRSLRDWDQFISDHPNASYLIMQDCPGSSDDVVNLLVAREVRRRNINIHLPEQAEIASGAVDFYLAGVNRTRETGSRLGVHSWSDGLNAATDFPRGHEAHRPYINYYVEMGLTHKQAEEFYYFTIDAAPADRIYWMTSEEIIHYGLVTKE